MKLGVFIHMRVLHFLIICFVFLSSFTMGDRLFTAKKGDYIVTQQEKNYSLLLVKELENESIILEEVTIPTGKFSLAKQDWKTWMASGAPGHTSWTQYEIDKETLKLIECYSFSKRGWLYLEESEHFLSGLLSLKLHRIDPVERKKIGPSPRSGEQDQRPLWNPSINLEGTKTKLLCDAWKGFWPKDETLLSSCQITLYFPPNSTSAFPVWIEANNGHFNYSIKIIDLGSDLSSFIKSSLPRRPPQIGKQITKIKTGIKIPIKSPAYYKKFSLFAFDLLSPSNRIGPIPFTLEKEKEKESLSFFISSTELQKNFTKDHKYKWILVPENSLGIPSGFPTESEDFFLWSP